MVITKKQKAAIRELLDYKGYRGNEILTNTKTGRVDTAYNWALEATTVELSFDGTEHPIWECHFCREGEEHEDCPGDAEHQFSQLMHVRKNRAGDYVEV